MNKQFMCIRLPLYIKVKKVIDFATKIYFEDTPHYFNWTLMWWNSCFQLDDTNKQSSTEIKATPQHGM